jgi:hypothetical protein
LRHSIQASQFAVDFLVEPLSQLISISSAQSLHPQYSLRVHRLVIVDAVDGASPLMRLTLPTTFVDEAVTLMVESTIILFGNAWHTQHTAHL